MKTASSSGDKYQIVAEINMIPFIDITLVLLIIVMVMTPFLVKEQIKINLPTTKSVNTPVDSKRVVQIDVTRDGAIRVDGTSVSEDGAYDAILKRLSDPENQPVVIAADRDASFEKVVVAMDAAKRCGAKHLGVSVKHGTGDNSPTHADEVVKPRNSVSSVDKTKSHSPVVAPGGTKRSSVRSSDKRKKDL
ncbi:MAG: biopolymer transporter ExbD [bacterium]